ncbi:MAG: glycerate kinase, partial [Verrucomicrobiota bacterium]
MSLRVLIVPDKFKGTLTAAAAAEAIAEGWRGVRPGDSLSLLPISDGDRQGERDLGPFPSVEPVEVDPALDRLSVGVPETPAQG